MGKNRKRELSGKQKARLLRELIRVSPKLVRALAFLLVAIASVCWL